MTATSLVTPCVVVLYDGRYRALALDERSSLSIGSSASCELRLDELPVDERHARLHCGAPMAIEDLGSERGTWLRGARLAPHRPAPLWPGEAVRLGGVELVVVAGASSGAVPEPIGAQPSGRSVVHDPRMTEIRCELRRIAVGDLSVLLLGETGVGKEIMAEFVHRVSRRAEGPFVRINCAAISTSLAESELFGHERGAFTGADETRPGLLEGADGGTVLLDEVGELTPAMQSKLLRVLDERRVLRVGGRTPIPIDVRFVAATNRDLSREVAAGRFREDLYYRLAGIVVTIPPLRRRRREIEPLAHKFALEASRRLGGRRPPQLSREALDELVRSPWPGNVRQLANVVERAVMLCDGATVGAEHLQLDPAAAAPPPAPPPPVLTERERIAAALEFSGGNQSEAARLLGISRRTLSKRLDTHGLPRPRKRS